ncbi:MAG TPA: tRNA dihydrouridine synthase DusB [Steroidobacteraceae bacterium]|nr:tRNA dihydrouridine synthase DusB [Steroidobacteraceae bacterium]
MTLSIGPHALAGRVLLAPMAGVTDPPFRDLCAEQGAALACGEMLSADQTLWHTAKSRRRMATASASRATVAVQLAGADPQQLAAAAQHQADAGADIIDLNLGCPAKKVCDRLCGSALLGDEALIERIFDALVRAVEVPVTVKIRTGPDPARRNATRIAELAERAGIAAIAVHGRTRADRFLGHAEYETIRAVKATVRIPVIANGDVTTPEQAQAVLEATGADALMIGRAALGSPWIFRDVNAFLDTKKIPPPLLRASITAIILKHLESLYAFYGEYSGVRMARKHLSRYCDQDAETRAARAALMGAENSASQFELAERVFGGWANLQTAKNYNDESNCRQRSPAA